MTEKEELYETMGELLYVVAKADGVIQEEEKEVLETMLIGHPFAEQIRWSFMYEERKGSSVEEVYKKVVDYFRYHEPAEEYNEFILAMEKIAEAADGVQVEEAKVMFSVSREILAQFQKDVDELKQTP